MARKVGEAPSTATVSRVRKKRRPLPYEEEAIEARIADKLTEFQTAVAPVGTIPMRALDSFYGEERMVHAGADFLASTAKRADELVAKGYAVRVV